MQTETETTPDETKITYKFPDGQQVSYVGRNIKLNDYSLDPIFHKQLYPYLPYYILRYEKILKTQTHGPETDAAIQTVITVLKEVEFFSI